MRVKIKKEKLIKGKCKMEEKIKHINENEFQSEVLDKNSLILVDFWAPWCGPCKALAPTLESIANVYDGKISVVKVNIDENDSLASKFNIRGIPNLILFKGGEVLDQIVGAVPQEIIEKMLEKYL